MDTAWIAVTVARRVAAAEGIAGFELVREDGALLPAFEAGAHIDVELPNGMVRPYSLCQAPAETRRYEIAVLLEPQGRGGSRSAHEALREGARLRIGPPRQQFALAPGDPPALLLAGGIGITPLLAMAEALHARGAGFRLHYATRSAARTAFAGRLAAAPWAGRVRLHHDDGPPAQRFDAEAALDGAPAGAHLYACGPRGFLDHVLGRARARGWDEARLHVEHFSGGEAHHASDGPFELALARSGRVLTVAAGQTAAAALAAAGVALPLSCEQGVCGTCLTRVLDGLPEHRDLVLSDAEHAANDQFTPCCSRARTPRLVIDL